MDPLGFKEITFVFNNDPYTISVSQTIALEKLTDQIKVHFDIKPDGTLDFIEIKTQKGLCPVMVNDFWAISTDEVPVYRIHVRESKRSARFPDTRRLRFQAMLEEKKNPDGANLSWSSIFYH